jgi:hypothetical protein
VLTRTFCHIEGIGHATERNLWDRGIRSWEELLSVPTLVPRVGAGIITQTLTESIAALAADPLFFTSRLAGGEAWRIFPHFRSRCAYLDIETTGLSETCDITTIALYDGETVRTYVNGINLDGFPADLERYAILVTYNGRCFDIPMIERYFRIKVRQAQIDLRYILARLGCRGGLKGSERQLGINRGALDGVDGTFAVTLWREYERYDNQAALETLLAYNIEDTVNLERLMVEAYNRFVEITPFPEEGRLPFPPPPLIPYQPDLGIMDRLRQR